VVQRYQIAYYSVKWYYMLQMEVLQSPRLPELSPDAQELVEAAYSYLFNAQVSDLLHPSTERESSFIDGVAMPVQELPEAERSAIVAMFLVRSAHSTVLDSLDSGQNITKVSKPHAYYELLRAGKKIDKQLQTRGAQVDQAEPGSNGINSQVVAGVVYKELHELIGDDKPGIKSYLGYLKRAQPPLKPGETLQTRADQLKIEKEDRLFKWRYARTLTLAAAAGGFAVTSFIGLRTTEQKAAPQVAALEVNKSEAYGNESPDERILVDEFLDDKTTANQLLDKNLDNISGAQVDAKIIKDFNSKIDDLKSKSKNARSDSLMFGAIATVALLRFGYWRIGHMFERKQRGLKHG
jgi:hypothetical protein